MLYANVAVYKYCRLRRYIESQGGVVSSSAQILSARRSFTRLARFTNQLLRGQLTCGPLTIQQFYTLESLDEGPRTMNDLAAQVGLHQSTLTRIVDRLERDGLVARRRDSKEKRLVEVALTGAGRKLYRALDRECTTVASEMLKVVPEEKADRSTPTTRSFRLFCGIAAAPEKGRGIVEGGIRCEGCPPGIDRVGMLWIVRTCEIRQGGNGLVPGRLDGYACGSGSPR
jgi:DNA-binding MarR family transcriptional regulator